MARPGSSPSDSALIVEGVNDKHVVRHTWFRHNGLDPESNQLPFQITEKEGKSQLLDDISIEVKAPNRLAVGFIVDADVGGDDTWRSIRERLRSADIEPPSAMDPAGTVIEPKSEFDPRVGVWIMPDNASEGELEDFVVQMVPATDPVWPKSENYIHSIPESERKFTEKKTTRAIVHAWLATREDPRQMGTAIRARDLQTNGELCQRFLAWLQRLFE